MLDPDKTVFEEIQDTYPDMDNTKVRNVLAAFLFTGDDVFKLIKDLSGGEKGRVSLAKLMLSDANLLYLDEPTNHLDIISKEILEQAVSSYKGTVIYVSHDRYFINKTATRIMELKDKHFITFDGTYDYYLEKRDMLISLAENGSGKNNASSAPETKAAASSETAGSRESWENAKKQQALQRKLENEFKKTEEEINSLEQRNSELDELMQLPENATVPSKLLELSAEHEKNAERLEILMKQWEELYERINQ